MVVASYEYDARGQLYLSVFANMTYRPDAQAVNTDSFVSYNFNGGAYNATGLAGVYYGTKFIDPLPETQWSPEVLAGTGVR